MTRYIYRLRQVVVATVVISVGVFAKQVAAADLKIIDKGNATGKTVSLTGPQAVSLSTDGSGNTTLTLADYYVSVTDQPAVTGSGALEAARTPTFGGTTSTSDGFSAQITNYDAEWVWETETRPEAGNATISDVGLLTVTGLSAEQDATVLVTTSRTGYATGYQLVYGTASAKQDDTLLSALTPTFEATQSTQDGFTSKIANYDVSYTYVVTASDGDVVQDGAVITVTGLSPGDSSTVTVKTSKEGHNSGQGTITSNAIPSSAPPTTEASEDYCKGSATVEYTVEEVVDRATGETEEVKKYYELNDIELRICTPDVNMDPLYIGGPEEEIVIEPDMTMSYPFTLPARADVPEAAYGYLQFTTGEPVRSGIADDYFRVWVSEVPNGPVLDGLEDCELYQDQADGYFYYTQDDRQRRMCYLGTESRILYMNFETRCIPDLYQGVCDDMNKRKSGRYYGLDAARGYKKRP